jgi:hypothetical protein
MTTISDLPIVAVKHITQLARGRIVAGTDSYARVSTQWRDAGSSEGSERLQLFMDLADMSEAAIERALGWLATHGKHIDVLVMAAEMPPAVPSGMLYSSVAAAANLQRLELPQQHSLVHLAPVLGQLQQLQHLEAHVAMVCHPAEEAYRREEGDSGQGIFVDHSGDLWLDLPDLRQQLCPRLTHLRLLVDPAATSLWLDEGLPVLLPPRLQQLELVGLRECGYSWVQSRLLSHLTSLQQLTLQRIDIGVEHSRGGLASLAQDLASLQQLRVWDPRQTMATNKVLQHLSLNIIDYNSRPFTIYAAAVTGLVGLTRLELQGEMPARVAALTEIQLQELALRASDSVSLVKAARLASRVPTLRHLQLQSTALNETWAQEMLWASLEQCTQLTSLHLAISMSYTSTPPFLAVPQQLAGLRCLRVPAQLLEQEAGAWLAPLTALTRLCLDLPSRMLQHWCGELPQVVFKKPLAVEYSDFNPVVVQQAAQQVQEGAQGVKAVVTEVLQQVEEWPASLQQVVVQVSSGCVGPKRMSFQFTPEGSAGGPFAVWVEQQEGEAAGWARPLHPCPHLPGVWELQGQAAASSSGMS